MSSSKDEEMLVPTVREVQQKFAELLSHGEDITWDLVSPNQSDVLRRKFHLFGDPKEGLGSRGFIHTEMFRWIWNQSKYTNGQSLTSLFFVMIVDDVSDLKLAEQSRSWHMYPVFRCRRCVDKTGQNSSIDCCMAYVTQHRSFENWNNFLKLSSFCQGVMVTPYCGVYKMIDGQVELKSYSITARLESLYLPKMMDNCPITPKSLAIASRTPIKRESSTAKRDDFAAKLASEFTACERMLNFVLNPYDAHQSCDASDLSDSLILFTHNVNNLQLATLMMKDTKNINILINHQRGIFDKVSKEVARIGGEVSLIRSANGVPPKDEIDDIFQLPNQKKRKPKKIDPEDSFAFSLDSKNSTITVKKKHFNMDVYGTYLKEHIVSSECFEILVNSMAEHLEPEMFNIIMELTQSFVENTKKEMCHLLKYYFSTESVLYQILLSIKKHYPNWIFSEVEEQSSEILRRVRFYFASSLPNSRVEFLKKCDKCVGYFDKYEKK
ncbi:uncharacterized protein LOC108108135 [Drosophila eugracilis]|uniref:uncharacterized protein LOC108108135 n=1 Tax=Drosophila eugracilis TaxID=29029 RepID=UPI0007E88EBD|nr:uncharacterized protein LOC108108135 [Drosophila eugracilis]